MITLPQFAKAVLVLLQMSKYLLALDQSTQSTGYAIFLNGQLLKHGCFSPSHRDYLIRISKLCEWVESIIDTLGDELEIAIEDIQLQEFEPNGTGRKFQDVGIQTFKKLAHVQGALLNLFIKRNIPYQLVYSSSWKKTCEIKRTYRNEEKKATQQFILNRYNESVSSDEADAICLGYHVLNLRGHDWT